MRMIFMLLTMVFSLAGLASGLSTGTALSDYFFEIAKGNITGTTYNNKFGRNIAVTTTEDVWGCGGLWAQPTSAGAVNFVSSSANDAAAGTGARTLTISGLDSNYDQVSETLTLNGTNNVATANSYMIINRVLVATAGSGAAAAGNITGTSTGGGTPVLSCINNGYNQTTQAVYQTPRGYTSYHNFIQACGQSTTNNANIDIAWYVKPFGGVFNLKGNINLGKDGTSCYTKSFASPLKYEEKSIIKFQAVPSAGSFDVSVDWDVWLVAN